MSQALDPEAWYIRKAKRTAIARRSPSRPIQRLEELGKIKGRVLDFGAGKGYDAEYMGAEAFDPNFNAVLPEGFFDTITMIYVLNVVPPEFREKVVRQALSLLRDTGKLYIATRDDVSYEESGKMTGIHTVQFRLEPQDIFRCTPPGSSLLDWKTGAYILTEVER